MRPPLGAASDVPTAAVTTLSRGCPDSLVLFEDAIDTQVAALTELLDG